MEIGVKVGDIMTRNFTSVKPETSLLNCAREMIKKRVGSLVLEENGKLKGLITEGDIIWALTKKEKADLSKIKASEIAPKKLVTIKPSADIINALERMKKTGYRWLPVVVKNDIIGLLTMKDILRIEPTLFDTAHEIMQIKEESEKIKRIEGREKGKGWSAEGICEECGETDLLYKSEGALLCGNCLNN